MLAKIRRATARGISSLSGVAVFVILLPITVAMMLVMLLFGFAARLLITGRLRKSMAEHADLAKAAKKPANSGQRQPIEGSYRVIDP